MAVVGARRIGLGGEKRESIGRVGRRGGAKRGQGNYKGRDDGPVMRVGSTK